MKDENKTTYVSCQLINGVTIIAECYEEADPTGHFLFKNPVRPVIVGDKLEFAMMNPFSESAIYPIHRNHILSVGSLRCTFIDDYIKAVSRIETDIQSDYTKLMKPYEFESLYVENESGLVN